MIFYDGRRHVCREAGQSDTRCMVAEHDCFARGLVVVWGDFLLGCTDMVVIRNVALNAGR